MLKKERIHQIITQLAQWLLPLGLLLTILPFPWLPWLGWFILALCYWQVPSSGIYATFFYATFFHSAEILKNPFLTIKHFHFSLFLFLICYLFQKSFRPRAEPLKKSAFFFFPLWALLMVFATHAMINPLLLSNIRIILNWGLVLCLFAILSTALITVRPETKESLLQTSISYFLFGVLVQAFVILLSEITGSVIWNYSGFHNTHFGSLSVIAVFLALGHWVNCRNSRQRILSTVLIVGSLAGLIFSLSRVAWFAFLISLLVLMIGSRWVLRGDHKNIFLMSSGVFSLLLVGVICCGLSYPSIQSRFSEMIRLATDISVWDYTFRTHTSKNQILKLQGTVYRIKNENGYYVFIPVTKHSAPKLKSFLWLEDVTRPPFPGIKLNTDRYTYFYEIYPAGNEYKLISNNFGFLGEFRRRDWKNLADIFRQKPWLGEGLSSRVADMHGFYIMLLAGSGIVGLSFFLFFLIFFFVSLFKMLGKTRCLFEKVYIASLIATVSAWLIISLLETHFLQFYIWIPFVLGYALIYKSSSVFSTGQKNTQ